MENFSVVEGNDVGEADATTSGNNAGPINPSSEVGLLATSAQQPDKTMAFEHGLSTTSTNGTTVQQEQPQLSFLNTPVSNIPPQFIMQMMQVMQKMSAQLNKPQETKVRINDIFLPSFDPDTNVGIREWCQHIDKAIETYKLSDFDIRMKVGSLLKGRAKMWVDDWMVTTSSWPELRNNLITTFEPENRYSRDIVRFREHVYDSSKDLSEYLSQAWVLWKRVTKDRLSYEDAVEAVIGCINDERLRIELLNARATTVPELISVASSIKTLKRSHPNSNNQNPSKRTRFFSTTPSGSYCRICKRNNHHTSECYYKPTESKLEEQNKTKTDTNNKEVITHQNTKTIICSFCKIPGHTFETCFKRERSLSSNVHFISGTKLAPVKVKIGLKTFHAIFDSGAECSLIRESIAAQLPGKRLDTANYLKGIGQFPVLSIAALVTIATIDNINVELQFHIVADYEITTDILIGMNLINDTNLTMIINSGGTTLTHLQNINHIRSINSIFDQLDCDLTNDEDIATLRTLLNKYQHMFIRGYPTTRVKTGELEIRLKNPDKYVERRPYRLSPAEREKVRGIVKELMEHDIIRESKSPFSSPIILVKKKNGDDRMNVDFRELNSNTLRDHYPLPLISDQIDQLAEGQYFSTFDMAAGFHQIPIAESSIEKTALKHPGWEKTLQKIKDSYWFNNMNTSIRKFVDNCVVCRTSKGTSGAIQAQMHSIQKPTTAFQVIHMDITGKLGTSDGQQYVIVTIDAFTKYVLLYYTANKNPHGTLAALKRRVHLFGSPIQIIVDGGWEFLGEFKIYCERTGIEIHAIAPGVSQANGQVERVVATVKNALIMIKNYETEEWHTTLEELQLALNCTPHRVTGVAPLTLLTQRKHCVPPELLTLVNIEEQTINIEALTNHVHQKMSQNSQQDKLRFDSKKAKINHFKRGDYVLIKNNPRNQTSLDLKFSEPYEITRVLDNDCYLVKRVIGTGRPRKVAHDQLRRAPQPGEQIAVSAREDDDLESASEPVPSNSQANAVEQQVQEAAP